MWHRRHAICATAPSYLMENNVLTAAVKDTLRATEPKNARNVQVPANRNIDIPAPNAVALVKKCTNCVILLHS